MYTFYREPGTDRFQTGHPIHDFLNKYKKLRAKGYSEYKAFGVVEEELRGILEEQLDETRILRGAAMAAHGDSYLDRAQRVAELESEMKLMRFIRDIPKHERNSDYLGELEKEVNPDYREDGEQDEQVRRDRLEDLFFMGGNGQDVMKEAVDYEPVMYKLVHTMDELKRGKEESLVDLHKGFLDRTERLLRQHQQRSHIHDGLKQLSDSELIQKVVERPTNLKKNAKGFLKLLKKHGVYLDEDACPVYDNVKDKHIRNFLQRKESLVRVTLMQADLEFEYPQKLEKILVKADLLNWLDEEEEKLKNIALEEFMEKEAQQKAGGKLIPGDEFLLTYDEYYGNKEFK